jgi:hypothetical protein
MLSRRTRTSTKIKASDLVRLENVAAYNVKLLEWKSPKGESLLEYLWTSKAPGAMTSLRVIAERFTLAHVLRHMKTPLVFLELLFSDPVAFAANTNNRREREVFEILESMEPMNDITFLTIFQVYDKRLRKRMESFVGMRFFPAHTRPRYDPVFLRVVGDAMPTLFRSITRMHTMPVRQSPYQGSLPQRTTVDMLVASLTYDHPSESLSIAMEIVKHDMNANTPASPEAPWSLWEAVEIAIRAGDSAMFKRIIDLARQLRRLGIALIEWKWAMYGYNMLHLALLYGEADMAIKMLRRNILNIDPRYPFVLDTAPRSRKPVHQRRRVIPTMDLVHELAKHSISPAKIQTLTQEIRAMAALHKKQDPRVRHATKVSAWTTRKYRDVQDARRGAFKKSKLRSWITGLLTKPSYINLTGNLDPRNTIKSTNINAAVAKHMHDHSLRAPTMPREMYWQHVNTPKALFRGVHGPIARELKQHGTYHDKGFVATSIRSQIAQVFKRKNGLMLQFDIAEIPKGTPWLWFSPSATPQSNMQMSCIDEGEVLLPPGTYTLGERLGPRYYKATYRPDPEARSLRGKKIVM